MRRHERLEMEKFLYKKAIRGDVIAMRIYAGKFIGLKMKKNKKRTGK